MTNDSKHKKMSDKEEYILVNCLSLGPDRIARLSNLEEVLCAFDFRYLPLIDGSVPDQEIADNPLK